MCHWILPVPAGSRQHCIDSGSQHLHPPASVWRCVCLGLLGLPWFPFGFESRQPSRAWCLPIISVLLYHCLDDPHFIRSKSSLYFPSIYLTFNTKAKTPVFFNDMRIFHADEIRRSMGEAQITKKCGCKGSSTKNNKRYCTSYFIQERTCLRDRMFSLCGLNR